MIFFSSNFPTGKRLNNLKQLFLLLLMMAANVAFAQLPLCLPNNSGGGLICFLNGTQIYNWDPALPFSATNPVLNTITLPAGYNGLSISENLNNTNGPSPTYYSVLTTGANATDWSYSYYNGTTWVPTGNTSGSTLNIGGGGGAIYGLQNTTAGNAIYKYTGTGNATFLLDVPGLQNGPADVQGETSTGNFYVINTLNNPWLRKYSPTGQMLQEWALTNSPNTGGGGGFAILNNTLYTLNLNGTIYKGAINNPYTIDLIQVMGVPLVLSGASDLAVCFPGGLPPLPPLNVNDTIFPCGSSTMINASGTENYSYTVLNGSVTITGAGPSFTVVPNTRSTILLHSTKTNGTINITDTFLIVPPPIVDAGAADTILGCGIYNGNLNGTLANTTPWVNYTLAWTPAANITAGANTLTPAINPTQNTIFKLTVQTDNLQGNCTLSDSVLVTVQNETVHAAFSFIIKKGCLADTVVFTNLSQKASQYIWNFDDGTPNDTTTNPTHIYTTQGLYTVRLMAQNATCNATSIQNINTRHTLAAGFDIDKDTLCQNGTITFTNTSVVATQPATFNWIFGDGTTSTSTNPTHSFVNSGIYDVMLITGDAIPCADTAYHIVIVDSMTGVLLEQNKHNICTGESVTFNAISSDIGNPQFNWNFNDGSIALQSTPATHAYDNAGTYKVELTTHFRACPDITLNDAVVVHSFPIVNLGPDTALCLDGKAIPIANLEPAQPGDQYLWNTGETTLSSSIKHPGVYKLTVTNIAGCSTTDEVAVKKDCYIDIPNSFTPNNDGVNDYFFPRQELSQGVAGFTMQVLNRWGEKIFESTTANGRGWDGKFNGKDQPEGVYIYVINVVLKNGRTEHYTGNVTLLR